jgi:hypothetical protein
MNQETVRRMIPATLCAMRHLKVTVGMAQIV